MSKIRFVIPSLFISLALSLIIFFAIRVFTLPVTDASDGEGHGPDYQTREWYSAIKYRTEYYKKMSVVFASSSIIFSFPASLFILGRLKAQ